MDKYDLLYEQENYYAEPYEVIVNFFERHPRRGKLLDLGCGQGRNALPLAKLGYDVTGLDTSSVGLGQLAAKAEAQALDIALLHTNAFEYESFFEHPYILADSFFQFTGQALAEEKALLTKILSDMAKGAIFAGCMTDSPKTMEVFTDILMGHPSAFDILYDNVAEYPAFQELKHILILKKL